MCSAEVKTVIFRFIYLFSSDINGKRWCYISISTRKSLLHTLLTDLCFCILQIRARLEDLDSANLAEVFNTDHGKYGKRSAENPKCYSYQYNTILAFKFAKGVTPI